MTASQNRTVTAYEINNNNTTGIDNEEKLRQIVEDIKSGKIKGAITQKVVKKQKLSQKKNAPAADTSKKKTTSASKNNKKTNSRSEGAHV